MALLKLGTTKYGEHKLNVYLLQGRAIRDAETKTTSNEKEFSKVSVVGYETDDGTTFVSVTGWRDMSDIVKKIRKGDQILAVGTLSVRDYNEKKYYDLSADFVCLNGAGLSAATSRAVSEPVEPAFIEMEEDEESDLPF